MEHYIGIDVSLELSSLCVLDATGRGRFKIRAYAERGISAYPEPTPSRSTMPPRRHRDHCMVETGQFDCRNRTIDRIAGQSSA
jgi:hypothetical protein